MGSRVCLPSANRNARKAWKIVVYIMTYLWRTQVDFQYHINKLHLLLIVSVLISSTLLPLVSHRHSGCYAAPNLSVASAASRRVGHAPLLLLTHRSVVVTKRRHSWTDLEVGPADLITSIIISVRLMSVTVYCICCCRFICSVLWMNLHSIYSVSQGVNIRSLCIHH